MIKYSHAEQKDYKRIQNFIKDHWSSTHILSNDNEVFNHFFVSQESLQFFLAKDEKGSILGILGYITNTQFDKNLDHKIAWLSMWMSKSGLKEPVGIKLIQFLEKSLNVDFVASLGVGNQVISLYERMGYSTGSMKHLMRPVSKNLNIYNANFKIKQFFKMPDLNEHISSEHNTNLYIEKKYLTKNFYKYLNFIIYKDNSYMTTLIGRILHNPESKKNIFRIVDFSGDLMGLSIFAQNMSFRDFYEKIDYIDILLSQTSFIDEGVFDTCSSQNYLPLYFEPFESSYIKKNFCFKKLSNHINKNLLIVTGDCDQERPQKRIIYYE